MTGDAVRERAGKGGRPACRIVPEGGNRAVVILAAGRAAELADRFRRTYDKEWFERVPPHVSLLGPFRPVDPDQKLTHLLWQAAEGAGPFEIRLADADAFIVPELFLFLALEDQRPLQTLHGRIRGALPAYVPARPYHPHLTLGRFVSEENLAQALEAVRAELRRQTASAPLVFQVEEIHLFGEDPATGVYQSVAEIALRGDQE